MSHSIRFMLLTTLVCCATPALADELAPLSVLTRATRTALQVRVAADEGHHLAEDFPARLVVRTIPETGLEDDLDLRGRVAELVAGVDVDLPPERPIVVDGELEIGVCDDAGTCRPYNLGFQVAVKRRAQTAFGPAELMAIQPILAGQAAAPQQRSVMGTTATWLMDDLDAALQQATRRDAPLLLVFKTRWCPPCNQLWSEVLANPEYAEDLEPYVRASFDADLPSSWEAKSCYRIGGYPTAVVCSADGEVLARIEGYEDAESWLGAVRDAVADAEGLEAMVAAAHETADPASAAYDPDASLAVADRYVQLRDRENSAQWFRRVPAGADVDPATRSRVAAYLAIEDPDAATGAAALEQLLLDQAVEPSVASLQQMWWWTDAAGLYDRAGDEQSAALAWQRALAMAEHVLSEQPELAGEAWYGIALSRGAQGDVEEESAAWASAADRYLDLVGDTTDAVALADRRGHVLSAAGCLRRAGRIEDALALLDPAIDGAPDEPALYLSRARAAAAGEGLFEQALADVGTAWRLAEGDLQLKAADTWSQLLVEQGRPDEAREVIEQTLTALVLPEDGDIRTHRYHDALQARLVEIGAE
jgi:tetratricopeptide (TPR) repeat protein